MNSPIILQERFSRKKLLNLADKFILPAVVVLVALGAFGLGRLSALEDGQGKLIIHPPGDVSAAALPVPWEDTAAAASGTVAAADVAHNFLASKNGTKYYLPSCSGAKKIAVQNQVWFATAAAAVAAGFEPAANCAGLQ